MIVVVLGMARPAGPTLAILRRRWLGFWGIKSILGLTRVSEVDFRGNWGFQKSILGLSKIYQKLSKSIKIRVRTSISSRLFSFSKFCRNRNFNRNRNFTVEIEILEPKSKF